MGGYVSLDDMFLLAKMVECGGGGGGGEAVPVAAFQKLCPRICKLLNSPVSEPYWSCIEVVSNLRKPYPNRILYFKK